VRGACGIGEQGPSRPSDVSTNDGRPSCRSGRSGLRCHPSTRCTASRRKGKRVSRGAVAVVLASLFFRPSSLSRQSARHATQRHWRRLALSADRRYRHSDARNGDDGPDPCQCRAHTAGLSAVARTLSHRQTLPSRGSGVAASDSNQVAADIPRLLSEWITSGQPSYRSTGRLQKVSCCELPAFEPS